MQTLKNALKKNLSGESLETQIYRFLFQRRLTPHSTTGIVPAELLLGRRPRSHLDFLFPDLGDRVRQKQSNQKLDHDRHCRERQLSVGQTVWVRNLPTCSSWLPSTISQVLSPQRFRVTLSDGRVLDRHIDHLRPGAPTSEAGRPDVTSGPVIPIDLEDEDPDSDLPVNPPESEPPANPVDQPQPQPRRLTRESRPPERFM